MVDFPVVELIPGKYMAGQAAGAHRDVSEGADGTRLETQRVTMVYPSFQAQPTIILLVFISYYIPFISYETSLFNGGRLWIAIFLLVKTQHFQTPMARCGCPEALTPIWTSGRLAEAAGKPIEMAAIFMAKICKTPWIHLISESIFDISMGSFH